MIIGHERQVALLSTHRARGAVSHAYIFSGPEHVGKATVARAFARQLLCHAVPAHATDLASCGTCISCTAFMHDAHPDVYTVAAVASKDGGAARIGITAMRALKDRASRSALMGGRKVYIVDHAASMTREAANSCLKALEEPTEESVFLLIVHAPEDVLPTIASRAWRVRFWPLSIPRMERELITGGAEVKQAGLAALLSFGRAGMALRRVTEPVNILEEEVHRLEHDVSADIAGSTHIQFACAERLSQDVTRGEVWYTEAMAMLQLAIHADLGLSTAAAVPVKIHIGFREAARTAKALIAGYTKAQYPYTNTRLQWEVAFAQSQ